MKTYRRLLPSILLAFVSPSPVFACAACFGKSNDPLAHGMNWGIFTMIGIVALMMSTIATFFYFLIRREAAVQKKMAEENLSGAQI